MTWLLACHHTVMAWSIVHNESLDCLVRILLFTGHHHTAGMRMSVVLNSKQTFAIRLERNLDLELS